MKIRTASSLALAAGLVLGMTGCGLMAPQATTEAYAPSDGIDVNVGDVNLRNVLLIADESGENFNVVFSAVNSTASPAELSIDFQGEGSQARAEFTVPEGVAAFGNPDGEVAPVLITIPGLAAGATIGAYFQIPGADEVQYDVPVLDGTLEEYRDYVLPAGFATSADATEDDSTENEIADEALDGEEVTSGS